MSKPEQKEKPGKKKARKEKPAKASSILDCFDELKTRGANIIPAKEIAVLSFKSVV